MQPRNCCKRKIDVQTRSFGTFPAGKVDVLIDGSHSKSYSNHFANGVQKSPGCMSRAYWLADSVVHVRHGRRSGFLFLGRLDDRGVGRQNE